MVKNQPAMQEAQILFLGWKDLLEKGMATHSSILAWEILWTEEPGYHPRGCKRVRCDLATKQQQLLTPNTELENNLLSECSESRKDHILCDPIYVRCPEWQICGN